MNPSGLRLLCQETINLKYSKYNFYVMGFINVVGPWKIGVPLCDICSVNYSYFHFVWEDSTPLRQDSDSDVMGIMICYRRSNVIETIPVLFNPLDPTFQWWDFTNHLFQSASVLSVVLWFPRSISNFFDQIAVQPVHFFCECHILMTNRPAAYV